MEENTINKLIDILNAYKPYQPKEIQRLLDITLEIYNGINDKLCDSNKASINYSESKQRVDKNIKKS